jgi:Polyketide cyclase / dehydrase and lipid transport
VAPMVSSIEIARPPEEVFSYVTDPLRLAEWQESVVSTRMEGGGPAGVGSRVAVVRPQARKELPRNVRNLKERLESESEVKT